MGKLREVCDMRTDAELKQDVIDELKWEPMINDTAIKVEVKDGAVTLSGYAGNLREKLDAELATESVFGVIGVIQKIEVKPPGVAERGDGDIAQAVENALEWNAYVPDEKIKVHVQNGWVTLSGDVDFNYQKDAASDAVCCLLGVKGIYNLIKVKILPKPSDIESKIENAFLRHTVEDVRRGITVKTSGSKAILTGVVHSYSDKRAAEQAALDAPGISDVENNLVVIS
jgi:osmotically-inducible protein OsmY